MYAISVPILYSSSIGHVLGYGILLLKYHNIRLCSNSTNTRVQRRVIKYRHLRITILRYRLHFTSINTTKSAVDVYVRITHYVLAKS